MSSTEYEKKLIDVEAPKLQMKFLEYKNTFIAVRQMSGSSNANLKYRNNSGKKTIAQTDEKGPNTKILLKETESK